MLDKISELFIFGLVPLLVGALGAPQISVAGEKVLKGEVTYRERIALPPNAELSVQLADVSLADAPAAVIGEQKVSPAGQVPIPFEIRFDPSVIRPRMTYALQARITVGNHLVFINDTRHQVDPLDDRPQTIVLKMVPAGKPRADAAMFGIDMAENLRRHLRRSGSTRAARRAATVLATAISRPPRWTAMRSPSAA